jgi:hypothetical protein
MPDRDPPKLEPSYWYILIRQQPIVTGYGNSNHIQPNQEVFSAFSKTAIERSTHRRSKVLIEPFLDYPPHSSSNSSESPISCASQYPSSGTGRPQQGGPRRITNAATPSTPDLYSNLVLTEESKILRLLSAMRISTQMNADTKSFTLGSQSKTTIKCSRFGNMEASSLNWCSGTWRGDVFLNRTSLKSKMALALISKVVTLSYT